MTGVHKMRRHTDTEGDCHVKKETKNGVTHQEAKGSKDDRQPPEAGERRGTAPSSEPPEKEPTLDFALPTSRTVRD